MRSVTLPRHGTGVIRKGSVERAKRIFENKEHSFGSVRRREEDLQDQGSLERQSTQGGAYKSPHSALLETTHRTPEQTKGSALPAGATSSTRRAGLEQYKTPHTSVATKATPKGGAEKDTEVHRVGYNTF
eukprot:g5772.t1